MAYQSGINYKLILTDFSMPVLDGIASTKIIRTYLTEELGKPRDQQPIIYGVTGHVH